MPIKGNFDNLSMANVNTMFYDTSGSIPYNS